MDGGVRGEGVVGGEGVEADVDGAGSTPIVVSTLFFLKQHVTIRHTVSRINSLNEKLLGIIAC